MSKPALQIVGYCTSTSAKLFAAFPASEAREASLQYRIRGTQAVHLSQAALKAADPFQTCSFEIIGLPPAFNGTEVEYCIQRDSPVLWNDKEAKCFRLLPSGRPLKIALLSCNNAVEVFPRKRRYKLWRRLLDEIHAGHVDLVIHAGDQIYADGIKLRYRIRSGFEKPDDRQTAQVAMRYRKLYMDTWTPSFVSDVLAQCPSVFMWDDHDIYDGYGSHDDDSSQIASALFRAANAAFQEFQAVHNPAGLSQSSHAFGFTAQDAAFLFLDTRSHRSWIQSTVLGLQQLNDIEKWLTRTSKLQIKHLFVISSIPFVYVPVVAYLKLIHLIGWRGPLAEDLRDSWSAPNNQEECRRFLTLLFQFAKASPKTGITVLSGDVHVAALGKIRWQRQPETEIHQVISSGIGSLAPSGISGIVLRMATEANVDIAGKEFQGALLPFPSTDDFILPKRNFAVMEPQDKALSVTYFAEDGGSVKKIQHSFG